MARVATSAYVIPCNVSDHLELIARVGFFLKVDFIFESGSHSSKRCSMATASELTGEHCKK